MAEFDIEQLRHPHLQFRIDNFSVPEESRTDFEQAMRSTLKFLESMPGFLGHAVYEKSGGPTNFNLATIAVWESREAIARAGEEIRAHHRAIGLDLPALMAKWGVRAEQGNFCAPIALQVR